MATVNTNSPPASGLEIGQGILKKLVMGAGLAASLALYLYEVVSHNPAESFKLLSQFGPSFLIGLVTVILFWDLLKLGVSYVGTLAKGVQDLASAVATIAEKDNRQAEEIQLIAQFNAQTSERILTMMNDQNAALKTICDRLDRMGAK